MDADRLKSIPLFASLSKRERAAVARSADEVDIREGKELVREGELAYEFFVIEDGTAEVRRDGDAVAELGPGDFFGEMGLMDWLPRNASVVATSPMTAIVMTGPDFRRIARDLPGVAERIGPAMEERSRSLAERV